MEDIPSRQEVFSVDFDSNYTGLGVNIRAVPGRAGVSAGVSAAQGAIGGALVSATSNSSIYIGRFTIEGSVTVRLGYEVGLRVGVGANKTGTFGASKGFKSWMISIRPRN